MVHLAPQILLTCLGYAGVAAKTERLASVSADEWRRVIVLARQHSVSPLLHHRLKSLALSLPVEPADELKKDHLVLSMRNVRLYHILSDVLQLLQEKNIAVMVLKGAYLAEAVYSDIGLRGMNDIDLLVKKDDLPRVEQTLLASGGEATDCQRVITQDNYHFGYKLPGSGIKAEIHWTLMAMDNVTNDIHGMWARSQGVTIAQTATRALSPEDLLLHLCLHMAKHVFDMQLRMLCDIGEVVRHYEAKLDWSQIDSRARRWGIQRAVYVILRLAQELLEAAVPADRLASLCPDDFNECYLVQMRDQIFADITLKVNMNKTFRVARLCELKSADGKLTLLFQRLFLSREAMALIYPAPPDSWRIYLYYPARIPDMLKRHGAILWRLLRGDPRTQASAQHINKVAALKDWLVSG
ncbi:MAG: nucleotidyltransferase family protein [Deltaproteobacteria bacterium]